MSIQSIERAAAILRCLSSGPRRLGVSELSTRLGLAKGTIHGILKTLHTEGFVEQDLESGKYQIGPALLQLGQTYLDVNELRKQSLVWSEMLASKSNESVRVGVLRGGSVLIVHHVFRQDNNSDEDDDNKISWKSSLERYTSSQSFADLAKFIATER